MKPIQHYTTNYSLVIYCTIMKRIGALDPSVKKVCEVIKLFDTISSCSYGVCVICWYCC